LIASENFASRAVNDALSSCLSNKYSEGYPGARYYAGNEFIDQVEILCQKRALQVFGLDPEKWGVNVQSLSGSPANFAVYAAVAEQHGRIMGLHLTDGGHLTHGFYTPSKKVSATSVFFESMPYKVSSESGLIDYDELERNAVLYCPKIIIAGMSCYTRWLDYPRFRKIADKCSAYLMADMAHISGLVAGGAAPSPFEYADIVTTTTHKTLRGPRGALIFYRKGVRSVNAKGQQVMFDIGPKIDASVFPALQGGPHNHTIAAIAVALKQCLTTDFQSYAHQVIRNAQAFSQSLLEKGYTIVTGGTDNHICLMDVRPKGLDASRIEVVLDMANITTNKNTVPGDKSAIRPGGIRMGTPALTSRGFKEIEFQQVADFIHKGIQIYQKFESEMGKTNVEFKKFLASNKKFEEKIKLLASDVEKFSEKFDLPGNELF